LSYRDLNAFATPFIGGDEHSPVRVQSAADNRPDARAQPERADNLHRGERHQFRPRPELGGEVGPQLLDPFDHPVPSR
jgi:hypothetical protein